MDLDWCWYLGVRILGMTEEEFMKSTPRKLFKLAEIHNQVNTPSDGKEKNEKPKEVYIDQLNF